MDTIFSFNCGILRPYTIYKLHKCIEQIHITYHIKWLNLKVHQVTKLGVILDTALVSGLGWIRVMGQFIQILQNNTVFSHFSLVVSADTLELTVPLAETITHMKTVFWTLIFYFSLFHSPCQHKFHSPPLYQGSSRTSRGQHHKTLAHKTKTFCMLRNKFGK